MMKSVPPNTNSDTRPWRKGRGEFHTHVMIQNEKTSQDQRGTNRPVGNVKRKAPRLIHTAPVMRLNRTESSGGVGVGAHMPKSVLPEPVAPKSTRNSETNRPIPSADLRQKIRRPILQASRDTTTSNVTM